MINLKLNEDLIDDFNKNGFLILDEFIDLKYLNTLKDRFEPLFKGEFETGVEPDEWNWKYGRDPNDVTRQICNAWKSDNLIKNDGMWGLDLSLNDLSENGLWDLSNNDLESGLSLGIMEIDKKVDMEENIKDALSCCDSPGPGARSPCNQRLLSHFPSFLRDLSDNISENSSKGEETIGTPSIKYKKSGPL